MYLALFVRILPALGTDEMQTRLSLFRCLCYQHCKNVVIIVAL